MECLGYETLIAFIVERLYIELLTNLELAPTPNTHGLEPKPIPSTSDSPAKTESEIL